MRVASTGTVIGAGLGGAIEVDSSASASRIAPVGASSLAASLAGIPVSFQRAENAACLIEGRVLTGAGCGGGTSAASERVGTRDFAIEVCAVVVCASGSAGGDACATSGCASVAWMIQSPCRGVGNGLDSASGNATPNTTMPD